VESLVKVLKLALEKTSYKTIWNNAVKRLMAVDFSWSIPAEE
jgi:hypothetical protein